MHRGTVTGSSTVSFRARADNAPVTASDRRRLSTVAVLRVPLPFRRTSTKGKASSERGRPSHFAQTHVGRRMPHVAQTCVEGAETAPAERRRPSPLLLIVGWIDLIDFSRGRDSSPRELLPFLEKNHEDSVAGAGPPQTPSESQPQAGRGTIWPSRAFLRIRGGTRAISSAVDRPHPSYDDCFHSFFIVRRPSSFVRRLPTFGTRFGWLVGGGRAKDNNQRP